MPSSISALFRASKRASLQMISTLVNLGEVPSVKEGSRFTGMASASGTSPVTATGVSSAVSVSGDMANPA